MGSIVFWVVVGVVAAYAVLVYNGLVSLKHNVSKAWSNIDVLLKQRHDELPKLVETCKQYMQFEQETLEKVMQARNQVASARESHNIAALGQADRRVVARLARARHHDLRDALPRRRAAPEHQAPRVRGAAPHPSPVIGR